MVGKESSEWLLTRQLLNPTNMSYGFGYKVVYWNKYQDKGPVDQLVVIGHVC